MRRPLLLLLCSCTYSLNHYRVVFRDVHAAFRSEDVHSAAHDLGGSVEHVSATSARLQLPDDAAAATLAAFLVLEASIGCFNACAATMRASYIPDDAQAAIMNLGRIPLNVLVVAGTYIAANAPAQVAFAAVAAALLSGAVLQRELLVVVRAGEKQF